MDSTFWNHNTIPASVTGHQGKHCRLSKKRHGTMDDLAVTAEHHFALFLTEKAAQTVKFHHDAEHMENKQKRVLKLCS